MSLLLHHIWHQIQIEKFVKKHLEISDTIEAMNTLILRDILETCNQ